MEPASPEPRSGPDNEHRRARFPVVDHGWVDDGRGVLSCVAGDEHTAHRLVVCPYYLREDVVNALCADLGIRPTGPPTVTRADGRYTKITALARPENWHRLIASLPARHGLHGFAWSLFTGLDRRLVTATVDPREALNEALNQHGAVDDRVRRVLAGLAADLAGSTGPETMLGLTGSAALDPSRLGCGGDIDLIICSSGARELVTTYLIRHGARFLADLATAADRRATDYLTTRMMPAIIDRATTRTLLGRRTDVAWIDELRIDLTVGRGRSADVSALRYEIAPVGRLHGRARITGVGPDYPVRLVVDSPNVDHILITARGYQGVFREGDHLRFVGAAHQGVATTFVSIDDAASHYLTLDLTGAE